MLVMNCAIVVQMYVINKQPNDNIIFIYICVYSISMSLIYPA